ncbi:FAD-dependent oxidoreductase [Truepera radiovictrix]|uniref:HI0933 family protein n=1 Tax=Truepera radiovictrix (strain DSM 17093 / CIP 108686 / LMG 22925 / RQ-24) TaxID=649638 RepID=D7CVU4_TRURR|nr:FAD-dependent oxidoreductase [Truepera radiovictrix]ADI16005.1 HI0933 family protein [Truepera radiovictrix DSM 17093]WMT58369.1 FAD-dependent oxidoreductase [Truepera radiovictrix]
MNIGTAERPLRVAIIGAGPSGFFAAEALLKGPLEVAIDLFDRLPTPFGLVRYGVAPDHQKIKSVTRLYQKTLDDPRVRFFGHVTFGKDVLKEELRRFYDALIYTVGAPSDRPLGIPGESLRGSLSATEFVAWYNGHPDFADLDPDVSVGSVAVIGMGNVAVDVTRILAKTADELRHTDIADHAIETLQRSAVRDIYMLGRRGPAQGKFTTKELRELGELANADVLVDPQDLELDPISEASLTEDPMVAKNVEVLREFAARTPAGKPRRIHIKFLSSPVEVLGLERVEGLRVEKNELRERGGTLTAVGTGQTEVLPVGMVLRSVGYRGVALPGVPFDERRAVIPNALGRVTQEAGGEVLPGEYVAGWIKRGPTGVIGTNKADAAETVRSLLEDAPQLPPAAEPDPDAVTRYLEARGVAFVGFDHWLELNAYELEAGKAQGRPRVKVTRLEQMLQRRGKALR